MLVLWVLVEWVFPTHFWGKMFLELLLFEKRQIISYCGFLDHHGVLTSHCCISVHELLLFWKSHNSSGKSRSSNYNRILDAEGERDLVVMSMGFGEREAQV